MSNPPFDPRSPLFPWYPPPVPPTPPSLADLITPRTPYIPRPVIEPKRPKIFVSYQHTSDQAYYDAFSKTFHDGHESIYDNSLERCIDSDKCDYVIQRIRDEFIAGTSCTILLVGPTAYQRKYLDWEIKATLDKEHGLIGIQLPNLPPRWDGLFNVPLRFAENVRSGYALWLHWNTLVASPASLSQLIADACARPKHLVVNPKDIKKQNG